MYVLESERCFLRKFIVDDAPMFYKLNLHPDIFRFTTDPPFIDVAKAGEFIRSYKGYDREGNGRLTVVLKNTLEPIGWCGLKFLDDEGEVDVGYRFLPEYWGNGYAAETGLTCCKYGFTALKLERIVARVHKENTRSIKVVEKIGMSYEKDILYNDIWWKSFVLLRSQI